MSQLALLSEAELTPLINQYLGLKLDKEDLIRPTRRVVTEIYSKFLDFIGHTWKNMPDAESNIRVLLISELQSFFSQFNEFDFEHNDIVKPVRKRTQYFLNTVIYYIVEFENTQRCWNQLFLETEEDQEKMMKDRDELDNKKRFRDELALEIGSHMSEQEYDSIIDQKNPKVAQINEQGENLKKEYQSSKTQLDNEKKPLDILEENTKNLRDGISSIQRHFTLNEDLEEDAQISKDLQQKRATTALRRNHLMTEIESNNMEMMESKAHDKVESLRALMKEMSEKMVENEKRASDRLKKSQELENYMNKAISNLSAKHEKSMRLTDKLQTAVTNHNMIIRSHFVKSSIPDTNINRTFTKSTSN